MPIPWHDDPRPFDWVFCSFHNHCFKVAPVGLSATPDGLPLGVLGGPLGLVLVLALDLASLGAGVVAQPLGVTLEDLLSSISTWQQTSH